MKPSVSTSRSWTDRDQGLTHRHSTSAGSCSGWTRNGTTEGAVDVLAMPEVLGQEVPAGRRTGGSDDQAVPRGEPELLLDAPGILEHDAIDDHWSPGDGVAGLCLGFCRGQPRIELARDGRVEVLEDLEAESPVSRSPEGRHLSPWRARAWLDHVCRGRRPGRSNQRRPPRSWSSSRPTWVRLGCWPGVAAPASGASRLQRPASSLSADLDRLAHGGHRIKHGLGHGGVG